MKCVLYDRECIKCGECNMCDLDPTKVCDNCCKCIDTGAEYRGIKIDAVITDDTEQRNNIITEGEKSDVE